MFSGFKRIEMRYLSQNINRFEAMINNWRQQRDRKSCPREKETDRKKKKREKEPERERAKAVE